jgi:sugar O-acyltransferase (sialic acid O-acetyltransferase NeuD family)
MKQVIGIGAGGHARVIADILRLRNEVEMVGFLDRDQSLWNTQVAGIPVLGDERRLPELMAAGIRDAFVGLGGVGDNAPRRRVYEMLVSMGLEVVSAVHPSAIISPSARLGKGLVAMAGVVINPDAQIGDNVILNTGAIVEHDCVMGAHVHIAPGACMGGGVRIEEEAHIGLGAILLPRVVIGARAIVGAGAVVLKDVAPGIVVAGVPAKPLPKTAGAS